MTKSRNWKLIRVTSSNEGLKHKCVDLSDNNRYLNQISHRTQIHYHTINTPEWPNSHKLKIQDGSGRHLEFRKKCQQLFTGYIYLHQILWEDASRPCGDDAVTESRNRKLILVMSSNECLEHKCVDLSDYNIYLKQI